MFLLRLKITLHYKLLFQMFIVFMNVLDRIFLWPIIGNFSLFFFFLHQDFFKPSFTLPGSLPWEVFLQHLCWWLYMACQWCFQFFTITVTFRSCLDSSFQSKSDMAWVRDTPTCTNLDFTQTLVLFPVFKTESGAHSLPSLQTCVVSYLWIIRGNRWEHFSD